MINLIKYEMKNNLYKYIITFIMLLILSIYSIIKGSGVIYNIGSVAASMYILFLVISSYYSDINDEKSYLIFTLPIKGSKILAKHLIVGCIINTLLLIEILGLYVFQSGIKITSLFNRGTFIVYLYFLLTNIIIMNMIYFSITISKLRVLNNFFRKFTGILVFVGTSFLIVYLAYKIECIFPQDIVIDYTKEKIVYTIKDTYNGAISLHDNKLYIGIVDTIYFICISIGLFRVTSYILDKKTDF